MSSHHLDADDLEELGIEPAILGDEDMENLEIVLPGAELDPDDLLLPDDEDVEVEESMWDEPWFQTGENDDDA